MRFLDGTCMVYFGITLSDELHYSVAIGLDLDRVDLAQDFDPYSYWNILHLFADNPQLSLRPVIPATKTTEEPTY